MCVLNEFEYQLLYSLTFQARSCSCSQNAPISIPLQPLSIAIPYTLYRGQMYFSNSPPEHLHTPPRGTPGGVLRGGEGVS